jgi:hypothetical protein
MEITTKNQGAKLVINCASMAQMKALKRALLIEIKNTKCGLKLKGKGVNLADKEVDVSEVLDFLKDVIISIDISDDLDRALEPCLNLCTYNNFRMSPSFFDEHPEALNDYYEIIVEVIKTNLNPFMKSLVTLYENSSAQEGINLILSLAQTSATA